MKRMLALCLLPLLFACNNQNKDSKEKTGTPVVASETALLGEGCGSLILFRKGAVIEGTSYDAAGKQTSKQTTTVTDVKEEAGMLVASSSAIMNGSTGEKTINLVYKCDGKNLYMDINSMLQNFEGLNKLKGDVKPIQFPINISVGQILPDASYTISMDRGAVKMDITSSIKNRTVSAKENITTTAGSWDCYKVTANMESDVQGLGETTKKIMDAVKNKMKMSMIMWYTPKIGVVRTEIYQNGKLSSKSDVTSIKE
jgi:hypothetical protein